MKRLAVTLVVVAVAGIAAQANAAKGWHRCQPLSGYGLGSLCDGRGRVLFPYVIDRSENSGYTQAVSGFRRTGPRSAIADTRADWGSIQGECGQNGVYHDCKSVAVFERIRYRTSDGGRTWRPIRFHRRATRLEGPGPDPPVQTGAVEDDPPLRPCDWTHSYRHMLAEGMARGLGNWCAPPDEWTAPPFPEPRGG